MTRIGYTRIHAYQNARNNVNIDDDSAKIGPIIKRIHFGQRPTYIGKKFIANHHYDYRILKMYKKSSDSVLPHRISREMGDRIYNLGNDSDYHIPEAGESFCLPTLNYNGAKENYNYLLLKHSLYIKINNLRKEQPEESDFKQFSTELNVRVKYLKKIHEDILKDKKEADLEMELKRIANNKKNSAKRIATSDAKKKQALFDNLDDIMKEEFNNLKSDLFDTLQELERLKLLVNKYKPFYNSRLSGITRYTLSSKEFHENRIELCNVLFGFPSWDIFTNYHKCWWPHINTDITDDIIKHLELDKRRNICEFEKSMIWLLKVHSEYSINEIANIFECTNQNISLVLETTSPRWQFISECIILLPISEKYLRDSMPKVFIDDGLSNVASLYDGKDFKTETIRSNSTFTRAQWSDKVSHSSFRVMTYSTPSGLVWLVSPAYFARASEQRVVSELGSVESVKLY